MLSWCVQILMTLLINGIFQFHIVKSARVEDFINLSGYRLSGEKLMCVDILYFTTKHSKFF